MTDQQPPEAGQLIPASNAALVRGSAVLVRRGLDDFRSRHAHACLEHGLTQFQAEEYQAAIASFTEVIRLDPACDEAYEWRHRAYSSLGKLPELVAVYTEAIQTNPTAARAYYYRAYARDYTEAATLADYTEAIRLDPDYALAYYMRGLAHFLTPRGDAAAALADFSEAIRLNPERSDTYLLRSLLFRKAGDYPAALADCSTAINLDNSYAAAYYDRAATYQLLGNLWAAIHDYEHYLELDSVTPQRRRQVEATLEELRQQLRPLPSSDDAPVQPSAGPKPASSAS